MKWKRVEKTTEPIKVIVLRLPSSLKEIVDKQAVTENKSVNLLLNEIIKGYIDLYESVKYKPDTTKAVN